MSNIRNRIVEIRKVRLGDICHNPRNFRIHPQLQRDAMQGTLEEIGWAGVPLVYQSTRTGSLTYVDGHLRKELQPDLEVEVAITDLDDTEADDLLTRYDTLTGLAESDPELLTALLSDVTTNSEAVQSMLDTLLESLDFDDSDLLGVEKDAQPNSRNLPIDVIYTIQGADATCCLAVRAGLKYGIQSASYTLCPYCMRGDENHKVVFVDNDYFNYNCVFAVVGQLSS